jgi:hypothetical protein
MTNPPNTSRSAPLDARPVAILARSLFRQMREQGYSTDQIIGLSSELLDLVRDDLHKAAVAQ